MSIPSPTGASSLHRQCPQCGRVAALGRRFCGGCRAVLVRPCAACGFGNERDDVWCGGCGASLAPRAGAAAVTTGASAPAPPRRPPTPPPARIHAPAIDPAQVDDLMAINARRPHHATPDDVADQERLDELFSEAR